MRADAGGVDARQQLPGAGTRGGHALDGQVFEAAAANLEPRVRLLGVDVDANQTLAQQLQVRSIPTLAIFRDGREVTRQAGAMSAAQFTAWVSQHT